MKKGHCAVTRVITGANEGNRTPDLLITNELLYQLSYIGLVKKIISELSDA
ncbi:MAG: hypothetical protein RLZZ481_2022 [Pseudomonadota bacterium]